MDIQINGQIDRWRDIQMERQIDGEIDRWIYGQIDGEIDRWKMIDNERDNERDGQIEGYMDKVRTRYRYIDKKWEIAKGIKQIFVATLK